MKVISTVVNRQKIHDLWPIIQSGIADYRSRTPHALPTDEELISYWSSEDGDEIFLFGVDKYYAGFMTFKVQDLDDERWGTVAIIYVSPKYQRTDVLPKAAEQLEEILRRRGCQVMNYFTKRKGFKRLAPRLGFQPRIIEWMKEL